MGCSEQEVGAKFTYFIPLLSGYNRCGTHPDYWVNCVVCVCVCACVCVCVCVCGMCMCVLACVHMRVHVRACMCVMTEKHHTSKKYQLWSLREKEREAKMRRKPSSKAESWKKTKELESGHLCNHVVKYN